MDRVFVRTAQWAGVLTLVLSSSTAFAFEPSADCDGWEARRFWSGAANAEAEAILEEQVGTEWVAVTGSTDMVSIGAAGELLLSGIWDTPPLDGTYRATITVLVYDPAAPANPPFEFVVTSELFACVPPPSSDPRGPGFWLRNPADWPTTQVRVGNATYDQECLINTMRTSPRGDVRVRLVSELIAAELNLAAGTNPDEITDYPFAGATIVDTVEEVHRLLGDVTIACPSGQLSQRPRGLPEAGHAWQLLRRYNRGCPAVGYCDWDQQAWHEE